MSGFYLNWARVHQRNRFICVISLHKRGIVSAVGLNIRFFEFLFFLINFSCGRHQERRHVHVFPCSFSAQRSLAWYLSLRHFGNISTRSYANRFPCNRRHSSGVGRLSGIRKAEVWWRNCQPRWGKVRRRGPPKWENTSQIGLDFSAMEGGNPGRYVKFKCMGRRTWAGCTHGAVPPQRRTFCGDRNGKCSGRRFAGSDVASQRDPRLSLLPRLRGRARN